MNKTFGICIPTYNRVNELKKCIESFLEGAKKYGIPIYVSDNNSDDKTEDMIKELQKEYGYIFYHKHTTNRGIDKNMVSAIEMAETEYALWLGSDDTLTSDAISKILNKLKEKPDLCILARENTVLRLKDSFDNPFDYYSNDGQIGIDGMHFSTLIVRVDAIKEAIKRDGCRYDGTLHTYAGVILDYIMDIYKSEKKILITTIKELLVNIAVKNKSWEDERLRVFYLYILQWFKLLKKEYKNNSKVISKYKQYLKSIRVPYWLVRLGNLGGGTPCLA